MLNHFTFNGHSTGELGLLVSGINIYGSPSRIVEKVTIPYRSGDLLIDTGAYTNYMLTYTVDIMDNTKATAEAISKWLLGSKGYCELTDTYNPEIYRVASYYNQLDYTLSALYRYGKATITFDCKPQKYLTANQPVSLSSTLSEATSYSLSSPAMPLPLTLEGNTTQNTLSGKNLLPTGIATVTNGGVTATRQTDGSYLLSGTSTSANADVYILSGEANRFSLPTASAYRIMQPTTSGIQLWLVIKRAASGNTVYNNSTFPMNDGDLVIGVFIRVATSGTNTNGIKVYPQIELGSTSTTYEPYCGGIPSPNPDYPQEIHSVSGDNEIILVGKNIFPPSKFQATNAGVTFTGNGAGDILLSGTSTTNFPQVQLLNGVTFPNNVPLTLSTTATNVPTGENVYCIIYERDTPTGSNVTSHSTRDGATTFTITHPYLYIIAVAQGNGITYTNTKLNIQLEHGTIATSYEAYKTKSYPINLPVENLFNFNQWANDIGVMRGTKTVSGNSITLTATSDDCYTVYGYDSKLEPIVVQPNTTYTLSWKANNNNDGMIYLFDGENRSQTISTAVNNKNAKVFTFNTGSHTSIAYRFSVAHSGQSITYYDIQLEKGSKANSYTPYGVAPIELNALSTFKDYIHKENGKWYLHKATGTADIGSLTWLKGSTSYYTNTLATVFKIPSQNETPKIMSSIGMIPKSANAVSGVTGSNETYINSSGLLIYYFSMTKYASATEFMNAMKGQTMIYQAKPTETEITNATLISQLNALSKAKTYDGATNIVQDGNDAQFKLSMPVPAEISSEYFGEPIITVNEVGTIVWNDSLIKVNSAPVTINSQTLQCYYYSENKNNDVEINEFPKYEQGENYIGSTMALTVVPNYWKL